MLDSGKKRTIGDTKVVSVIGQGTTVVGEVKSKGTVRIEGAVSGRVHSDDVIQVQETGRVKGDMVAAQVVIGGEVEGNVYAHERIEITSSGKLLGDIVAPRVSIAEGVLFEGKCTMKPPGQPIKPAPSGSPTPGIPGASLSTVPRPMPGGPAGPAPTSPEPPKSSV